MINTNILGKECERLIKSQSWFPYKKGNLRDNATIGFMYAPKTFCIHFTSQIADYIEYLEEGTTAHDIPHAFGFGSIYPDKKNPYTHQIPFGVGGRFNGKFHPGSMKHKGFISEKSVMAICNYIAQKYNGRVEKI